MANAVLAKVAAGVSKLKRHPMGTVAASEAFHAVILNRNEPAFYCVPVKACEALMEKLDDIELNAQAGARISDGKAPVKVRLDKP
ncbi:MAG: plasmid stabilization protein [Thiobacillus sp.]